MRQLVLEVPMSPPHEFMDIAFSRPRYRLLFCLCLSTLGLLVYFYKNIVHCMSCLSWFHYF